MFESKVVLTEVIKINPNKTIHSKELIIMRRRVKRMKRGLRKLRKEGGE